MELIETYLPPWDRACHLSDAFINHAAWLFRNVSKDQIMLELLPITYRRPLPENAPPVEDNGPHEFALMFLILAIGALVDLNQDPYNAEGEHYHQIARAALCLQPVLEKPSVVTIQALHLLSVYNGMAGNEIGGETSLETTWSLTSFAAQLSHSVCSDCNFPRWDFSLTSSSLLLFHRSGYVGFIILFVFLVLQTHGIVSQIVTARDGAFPKNS